MAYVKYLVFSDGREIQVAGDDGRYWLTMEGNFKKSNPAIVDVRRVKVDTEPLKKDQEQEADSPAEEE